MINVFFRRLGVRAVIYENEGIQPVKYSGSRSAIAILQYQMQEVRDPYGQRLSPEAMRAHDLWFVATQLRVFAPRIKGNLRPMKPHRTLRRNAQNPQ